MDGFRVLTQLDETMLQWIADTTNGAYFRAEDEAALKDIYRSIDLRLAVRGEKLEVTSIFAGVSLGLFLAAGALSLAWFGRVP
jgi:Ca-activated chloride channel family protein